MFAHEGFVKAYSVSLTDSYIYIDFVQMFVCRFMQLFVPDMNVGHRYQNTVLMLTWILEIASYINSSFNIFIYYSMGSKYRETVKELFCGGRVTAKNSRKEQTATISVVMSTVSQVATPSGVGQ